MSKRLLILVVIVIGLFIFSSQIGNAFSRYNPSELLPGKYLVYKEGSTYYSKSSNGVAFSGSDASDVIQSSIDSLSPDRVIQEKVVLQGDIALTSQITLDSNTILDATDASVTWESTSGIMLYAKDKNNIEVIGGDWDKNNIPWEIFAFNGCTNVLIKDLTAHNADYDGISISNGYHVTIFNVHIGNVGHTALVMAQTSNSLVEDCHFHDCTTGGGCYFLCDHGIQNAVSNNNVLRGNIVERTALSGLSMASLRESSDLSSNNLAEDNTLIDCGLDGMHQGIACGWGPNRATHNIIRNNLIYQTEYGNGRCGGGIELSVDDSLITNNIVKNVTDFGIGINGDRNTISYNRISGVTTSFYPGIDLGNSVDNEIIHNIIFDCPYGVMIFAGEYTNACSNNHIAYNHFESITNQIAYIHDNACVGNIFENNTYQGVWRTYDNGTGTILRNNSMGGSV